MIRINLLAKEETPRVRTLKLPAIGSFVPVGVAAAAAILCLGTFLVQKRTHDRLTSQVAEAREESQKLAPQIARIKQLEREREQLDNRLDAITMLDRERYFRVQLMSELSRRFPDNAWLTQYSELSPSRVELKGITFNNFVVSDFMQGLGKSENYEVIDLSLTNRGYIKDVKVLEFSLTADVKQPIDIATEL